jgi:hypothetical protein
MQTASNVAFKEWAVVCAALASGRQTIILRKGGIEEGREGFRVQHREFWLLPTRFHQAASQLVPDAEPLWCQVQESPPPPGTFVVDLYALVQQVIEVRDTAVLKRLNGLHILSQETLEQRFRYRHPGLFILVVRTYRLPRPYIVSDSPYIAGCKSWVELPAEYMTTGAKPVLDDVMFEECVCRIEAQLNAK